MRIKCDNCGKKFEIPSKHIGKKFPCAKCGEYVRTASLMAKTEPVRESKGLAVSPPVFDHLARGPEAEFQFEDDRPRMAIPFLGMTIFVIGILGLLFVMAYIWLEHYGLKP